MLEVTLKINIKGNDILLSYDEGKALFDELASLYIAPLKQENNPFDSIYTPRAAVNKKNGTGACDYTDFNNDVADGGKSSSCDSAGINVPDISLVDDEHLEDSSNVNSKEITLGDKDIDDTLAALDLEIEKRVAKMKELVSDTNKQQ